MIFELSRSKWAAFLFVWISFVSEACGASFHLPDACEDPSISLGRCQNERGSGAEVIVGGAAGAGNNLGSLWDITDYGQPVSLFLGDSAFAQINRSRWVYARRGGWWVGSGSGWIESYTGNRDAAQLWLDLHSGSATKPAYTPNARYRKMSLDWMTVGRRFPIRTGHLSGVIDISLRHLQLESFEELALDGWVVGDQFAGPVSRLYSSSAIGTTGRGWCVDAAAELRAGTLRLILQVEGLTGRLSWDSLTLDSGYLSSPRVFTDADGFLRDVGGDFSGVTSKRGIGGPIDSRLRLAVAGTSERTILLSAACRKGDKPSVSVGVMRSGESGRFASVSYNPRTKAADVALGNSRLKLRLRSDSWLFRNPRYTLAEVSLVFP